MVGKECPECGAEKAFSTITSRMIKGQRYRQKQCRVCGYRTSEHGGEPVAPGRAVNRGSRAKDRKFNAEQIAEILALKGTMTQRAIGQMFGCSGETIRQIFAGMLYQDLAPGSYRPPPKPGEPSCEHCRFWEVEHCGIGFPDPLEEGPGFARDCSLFVKG
jgi:hypothetical protein